MTLSAVSALPTSDFPSTVNFLFNRINDLVGHLVRNDSMLICLFWHGRKDDSARGRATHRPVRET